MVDISECHFIYKDINSRKYNLIFANIETERFRPIVGQKSGAFIFNKASKSRYLVGDTYADSPLEMEVEILTCHGRALDIQTVREVERWLFTNSVFNRLYIDIEDDPFGETYEFVYGVQSRLYFNCRFIRPEKIESDNGIIGFRCIMQTDSMMLWQDEVSAFIEFGDPEIITQSGGTDIHVIRGDANGDGIISAEDPEICLVIATYAVAGYRMSSFFYDDGTVKEENLERLNRIPLPKPITRDALRNCLIACDFDYSQADYDNGVPIDFNDVGVDDARNILEKYTAKVSGRDIEVEYVDIDGHPVPVAEDVRAFKIDVDSDIDGYTYPIITISVGTIGGQIEIENINDLVYDSSGNLSSEVRKTVISNTSPKASITIDSVVSRLKGVDYDDMTNKYFPRLVEGENILFVKGDVCTMNIEWQNRRFL